jgi:site-specific DNA-methyltransferase (adenine-specific)
MPPTPYWEDPDTGLALYHGDMREILPQLGLQADCVIADPPYGDTALDWDTWPTGWLKTAAAHSNALWCFGSQRMFFDHLEEFRADWTLSQDIVGHDSNEQPVTGDVNVVWEKHNGSGFAKDRFRRVHEHALLWYRGPWDQQHRNVPRARVYDPSDKYQRSNVTATVKHTGKIGPHNRVSDGKRLMRSVIKVRSMHGRSINETEKPLGIIEPLIHYSCPPGGTVLDPMAGSCSVLEVARLLGRPAIGIEKRESQCEAAARRLDALTLPAA